MAAATETLGVGEVLAAAVAFLAAAGEGAFAAAAAAAATGAAGEGGATSFRAAAAPPPPPPSNLLRGGVTRALTRLNTSVPLWLPKVACPASPRDTGTTTPLRTATPSAAPEATRDTFLR